MKELWDAILRDALPTIWLRLIAGAGVPLVVVAFYLPELLNKLGVPPFEGYESTFRIIGTLSVLSLFLGVLLVCVILEHRSSRLAAGQFVEHRGAFFKRKQGGGYSPTVYCGSCRTSTTTEGPGEFTYEKFVCVCGWKSDFNLESLDRLLSELPR
jgi:hypothetical protein